MTRNMLGRWVAGVAVFAALAVGLIVGGGRYTAQEIVWSSNVVGSVLR